MKKSINYIRVIMTLMVITFNSCTLFIDDDNLFNSNSESLPTYHGKGYDEPVTGKGEYVDVTYQLYENTMTIQPEDELTKYIHRVDTLGDISYIYIDKNTPKDLIPKVGQMIVSGNIDLFPHHGLCDMVYSFEEKEGDFLIKSVLSKPELAFKELQVNTHIPLKGLFGEYEVFDENGNSLGVINQEEELNKIRARRAKDVNGVARRFQDKEYDINFNTWGELSKSICKTILDGFMDQTLYKNERVKVDFTPYGGINFPETDIEANLNPFSDDPMFVNVTLGRGEFDVELDFNVNIGMDSPRYVDLIPKSLTSKLNTPKAFMIGPWPVVIVPNIFAQLGIQAKASIHFKPWLSVPWGDENLKLLELERGTKQKRSTDGGLDIDGEGEIGVYFLVNLGLGLYTDAVTFNAQPQIRWLHTLNVNLSGDNLTTIDEEASINPTYTQKLDLGIGLKIIADGGSFKHILAKIKEKVSDYFNLVDKATAFASEYYKSGSVEDWTQYLTRGEFPTDMDESIRKEMEKMIEDKQKSTPIQNTLTENTQTQRQKIIEGIIDQKAKDKKKVDEEMDIRNQKNVHEIDKKHLNESKNKNKKFELAFGPWWPAFLNLYTYQRYWYPKIDEKTLHVGASFENGKLVLVPSYQLKDHGLKPLEGEYPKALYYWEPGFLIKLGSEEIPPPRWINRRINNDTPSGQQFKTTIKDLDYLDETLTCIPFFELIRDANAYGLTNMYRIYDRATTFSVTTPAMAITRFQLTNKPTHKIENGRDVFYCEFDIYVNIRGLSSIADWGIRENNSQSENKYKSSSEAVAYSEGDERSGEASYLLHYSITSEDLVTVISLSPYAFLTGQTTSDPKKAKYFADWQSEIDFGKWFTGSSSDNYSHSDNYTLTLESVEYIPYDDELEGLDEDGYDYDEE